MQPKAKTIPLSIAFPLEMVDQMNAKVDNIRRTRTPGYSRAELIREAVLAFVTDTEDTQAA